MTAARIPPRYEKCSFGNFICEPGTSQENAVIHAHKLAREYPAVDRGLIFMGPPVLERRTSQFRSSEI